MPLRSSISGTSPQERDEMVLQPYEFYQAKEDTDGKTVQFDLPPTGVRRIYFFASTKGEGSSTFTITLTKHPGEYGADPDGDNYTNYDDCHDTNKFIYLGASEQCNGIDDNCNSYNYYNHSNSPSGFAILQTEIPVETSYPASEYFLQ